MKGEAKLIISDEDGSMTVLNIPEDSVGLLATRCPHCGEWTNQTFNARPDGGVAIPSAEKK